MYEDRDDAVVILLDYAMRDLHEACSKLADPQRGWLEFVGLVVSVLKLHPERWSDVEQLCLSAARLVRAEILAGL